MLRRRWPRPTFRSIKRPSSSGPRCVIMSRIASSTACETNRPDLLENAIPLMPHIYSYYFAQSCQFFVRHRSLFRKCNNLFNLVTGKPDPQPSGLFCATNHNKIPSFSRRDFKRPAAFRVDFRHLPPGSGRSRQQKSDNVAAASQTRRKPNRSRWLLVTITVRNKGFFLDPLAGSKTLNIESRLDVGLRVKMEPNIELVL